MRPALKPGYAQVLQALLLAELRLRMRRRGTMVTMLVLIAVTWLMIEDPASGRALMVVDGVRVAYTGTCLAMGGAVLGGLLFGLAGFYLVRGRMNEDMRMGTGAVIGATAVGNAVFLLGRWLGSVAYLCCLMLIFMATMVVLHAVRGEGPLQALAYLQAFLLVLVPLVLFIASCALLWECWPPLAGKGGDVLYFLLFVGLIPAGALAMDSVDGRWSPLLLLDVSGVGATVSAFKAAIGTTSLVIGGGDFNSALAPMVLPESLWTASLMWSRVGTALLALLPLLPALALFHRFSPDRLKVRAGTDKGGWSPLALLNRLLRPLARLVRPLFVLAARVPGPAGYALAVVALTLACNPIAILAALLLSALGCFGGQAMLNGVVMAAVALWGILVSDLSVRDSAHDVDAMSAAVPGGARRRFGGQWLAACMLALLFLTPALLRWTLGAPMSAAALVSGLSALAAAAILFGRASRSGRVFLALFLFGWYVATQVRTVPALDVAGFNGVADGQSVTLQLLAAVLLLAAGLVFEKRAEAR